MPVDSNVILPWTMVSDGERLVLRRPIAPPDLIVGGLYGALGISAGMFGLAMIVRAVQFRNDPVGPWVLGLIAVLALALSVWALRALRSDVVREIEVSPGRLGLGQGGLLGLRRSVLVGTQMSALRILHRHFKDREEDRRWTELYLELPSMPDRFLGFFAGGHQNEREKVGVEVAERLGVMAVIVHE